SVGSLLCLESWQSFASEERDERSTALNQHQYGCLMESRWALSEVRGTWGINRGDLTSAGVLVSRINRWLAIKRQGRWAEVQEEIAKFDSKVLDPKYLVAIHALTDNLDALFRLLPKAEISDEDLREWPILDEARKDPRFE